MPRLTRATPRLCRVRNQAVVYLGGETHYLGRYGSPEAKRRRQQVLAEWEAADRPTQPTPAPAEITVAEVCRAYKRFVMTGYRRSDGTLSGEVHPIKAAVKALRLLYGPLPASDFGPRKLKALRQQWVDCGLARPTIDRYVVRIKRLFKWAVSEELLQPTVYQALAAVDNLRPLSTNARESIEVQPVDDADVEATLPHLSPVIADMVRLQRLTGCRPGEVCIIRPCDVEPSPPSVDPDGETWLYRPHQHKTKHKKKPRVIVLNRKAQNVLCPYLSRPLDSNCFSPKEAERERRQAQHKARVTPLEQGNSPGTNQKRRPMRTAGERYTTNSYSRAIGRGCEAAFAMPAEIRVIPKLLPDVPPESQEVERGRLMKLAHEWRAKHCWSPNQLRHAFATEVGNYWEKTCGENGELAVQASLGHSGPNMAKTYFKRNLSLAVKVAKAKAVG